MRIEHYPLEKLKREVLEIIGKYLNIKEFRVFFFGSRVEGKGNEHSDIDIGIEGEKEISYETISAIREEIENLSTLYKIEVVDFKKTSDDFREVALQSVEPITL